MSLRDGDLPSKQSPVTSGDCFAKCARNDMQEVSLRELQSATGEELRLRTLLRPCWIGLLKVNYEEEPDQVRVHFVTIEGETND